MSARMAVKRITRTHLTGASGLCAKAAATEDVPEGRIRKSWSEEETKCLRVWELREMLPGLLAADPAAALDYLADVLGLRSAGVIVARAPRVQGAAAVAQETDEALLSVAAVKAWQVGAAPGGYAPDEIAEGRTLVRRAERELVEADAALRAVPSAQVAIPGAA